MATEKFERKQIGKLSGFNLVGTHVWLVSNCQTADVLSLLANSFVKCTMGLISCSTWFSG